MRPVIIMLRAQDDVIKWKPFPRNWPFVRGIHRFPVNSPHKGQWRWALMFTLICVWINGWVNNREAGDLRRYRVLSDVIVMSFTDITHYKVFLRIAVFKVILAPPIQGLRSQLKTESRRDNIYVNKDDTNQIILTDRMYNRIQPNYI